MDAGVIHAGIHGVGIAIVALAIADATARDRLTLASVIDTLVESADIAVVAPRVGGALSNRAPAHAVYAGVVDRGTVAIVADTGFVGVLAVAAAVAVVHRALVGVIAVGIGIALAELSLTDTIGAGVVICENSRHRRRQSYS